MDEGEGEGKGESSQRRGAAEIVEIEETVEAPEAVEREVPRRKKRKRELSIATDVQSICAKFEESRWPKPRESSRMCRMRKASSTHKIVVSHVWPGWTKN